MYRKNYLCAEHLAVNGILVRVFCNPFCVPQHEQPEAHTMVERAVAMSQTCGLAIMSVDIHSDGVVLVRWSADINQHEVEPGRIYWRQS